MAGDLKDPEWAEVFELLGNFRALIAMANDPTALVARLGQFAHINEILVAFLMKHTKREIFEAAAPRRIMMVPAQSPKDLIECPQLEALGYFVDVEHPELGTSLKYPGAPCYHISDAPWRISRRAPLIGEHNADIYEKELGLSREQLAILKQEGAV